MLSRISIRSPFTVIIVFTLLLYSCGQDQGAEHTHEGQTYTCPMHPQVVQQQPGTCPLCGMDLVAFDKSNEEKFLILSRNQQLLANVSTVILGNSSFENQTYLNGRLLVNPEQTKYISSRIAGRIEQLHVKETGIQVIKGQPLYKIYSEQLQTLQNEYLLMEEQARKLPQETRFRDLADAARQKLRLYGQTDSQLDRLLKTGTAHPYVTYLAPSSGVISDLMVVEGEYVGEGSSLMMLEDYRQLWVEADAYTYEAAKIKMGDKLKVIISGSESESVYMTVNYIGPALAAGSQTVQIRGVVENKGTWQPGLQVNLLLTSESDGDHFSLPVNAVIRDATTEHVWIETRRGRFEPRAVVTGIESSDTVEVLEGIKAGDKVVVTGAYLLYSEYILKKGEHPVSAVDR